MTTSSSTESQPSTSAHQAVGRHWDRLPVPGEDFLKRKSTKTKLGSVAPPSDIFSATEHFGVHDAAGSPRDRQPIMATTFRSASPPESKLSSVLTSATKLHLACKGRLEEPCFTKVGIFALSLTVPSSVTSAATEQDGGAQAADSHWDRHLIHDFLKCSLTKIAVRPCRYP
jgi:hypothetical protein